MDGKWYLNVRKENKLLVEASKMERRILGGEGHGLETLKKEGGSVGNLVKMLEAGKYLTTLYKVGISFGFDFNVRTCILLEEIVGDGMILKLVRPRVIPIEKNATKNAKPVKKKPSAAMAGFFLSGFAFLPLTAVNREKVALRTYNFKFANLKSH